MQYTVDLENKTVTYKNYSSKHKKYLESIKQIYSKKGFIVREDLTISIEGTSWYAMRTGYTSTSTPAYSTSSGHTVSLPNTSGSVVFTGSSPTPTAMYDTFKEHEAKMQMRNNPLAGESIYVNNKGQITYK
jgi:hypothetical protein